MKAKSLKLSKMQQAEIKSRYMQMSDTDLASLLGVNVKTVSDFLKSENLIRGAYTLKKLGMISEIDVVDSKEVKP